MALGDTVVNRIITVDDILNVAHYLNESRKKYEKLISEDAEKIGGLEYKDKFYEFFTSEDPKVTYSITYKDNRTIKQYEYDWFLQNIEDFKNIIKVELEYNVHYKDDGELYGGHKRNHFIITFREEEVRAHVYSKNLEAEANRTIDDIMNILYNTPERYNNTIKKRTIRIQTFCLSIGFLLTYILFIALRLFVDLPEQVNTILDNKNVLIIGQWVVALFLGNLVGNPIMSRWYADLLPKRKYAGYNRNSHESVYIDNLEDYTGHCEVQIGKFANNGKNRRTIEKVYQITKKIVLVQLAISVLLYLILK